MGKEHLENKINYEKDQQKIDIFYNRLKELKEKAVNKLNTTKKENDEHFSDTAKSERDSYAKLYSKQVSLYTNVHNQLCFGKL